MESIPVWKMYPDSISWLSAQKYLGSNAVPTEHDLIKLLNSGKIFLMKCTHTDLNNNGKTISTVIGTQSRDNCVGSGLSNFVWPRQLDRPHQASGAILFHDNNRSRSYRGNRWRQTKYSDIIEVPYWQILLQFLGED